MTCGLISALSASTSAIWADLQSAVGMACGRPGGERALRVLDARRNDGLDAALPAVLMLQYALQLVALVLPATAARIAMDVRFFQSFGVASGAAVSIGAFVSARCLLLIRDLPIRCLPGSRDLGGHLLPPRHLLPSPAVGIDGAAMASPRRIRLTVQPHHGRGSTMTQEPNTNPAQVPQSTERAGPTAPATKVTHRSEAERAASGKAARTRAPRPGRPTSTSANAQTPSRCWRRRPPAACLTSSPSATAACRADRLRSTEEPHC